MNGDLQGSCNERTRLEGNRVIAYDCILREEVPVTDSRLQML
jgi:hypothetical protein